MRDAKVFTYRYAPSKNMLAMQQAIEKYGLLATAFTVVDSFSSYAYVCVLLFITYFNVHVVLIGCVDQQGWRIRRQRVRRAAC